MSVENTLSADWPKASWDLPASNLLELLSILDEQRMSPEDFMLLPVYRNNIESMPWLREMERVAYTPPVVIDEKPGKPDLPFV